MKGRILVLDPIDAHALDRLRDTFEVVVRLQPGRKELIGLVGDADAIVLRSGARLSAEVLSAARRLRVVARAGSGTDNIDLAAAREAGVRVFNVPGASAEAVAELALGLTLALTRKIALADRQVRAGVWDKPALAGPQLAGRTLGVVGYGGIGSRVAALAQGFSMRTLAAAEHGGEERRRALARQGTRLVELPVLLRESDVVCLAVPLTARTRHLIAAPELHAMRRSAYLVNVSRGGVVDEDALAAALRDGTIAGAALDVFTQEGDAGALAALDNVVLTPHIGAMSVDVQRLIGDIVADSIITALDGGAVANQLC